MQEIYSNNDDWFVGVGQVGVLTVVDAYPKWTGACKSIVSTLKRMKLELSSPRLKFATACIDEITDLQEYRDQPPEPLFLFYATGVLVDMCQGCNVPLLTEKIKIQLKNEDAIEEGSQERKTYVLDRPSTAVSHATLLDGDDSLTEVGSKQAKQLSFAFVTPIYIDCASAVREKFEKAGMEVLAEKQHQITREELVHIFPDILDERKFLSGEMFIDYITSGTSCLFVLTREGEHGIGAIDQALTLIGPSDQDTARVEAPDSVNAQYGNTCMWASLDADMANRAVNLIFDDFGAPMISARASAVNAASYTINLVYEVYGPCSDEFQVKLQNYGCQVVEAVTETPSMTDIPEEHHETATNMMVISCAKSLQSIQAFCESAGDEGVFVKAREISRPTSVGSFESSLGPSESEEFRRMSARNSIRRKSEVAVWRQSLMSTSPEPEEIAALASAALQPTQQAAEESA